MLGLEDIGDDGRWMNVQDPIKGMFLALTKAVRSQAVGIRELDNKYNNLVSYDNARRLIKDTFELCCSKQDATQMLFQIDRRVEEKEFAMLESRFTQVTLLH